MTDFQPRVADGVNWYGAWTLYQKEVRHFLKMPAHTVLAPTVTGLLFLAIFTLALGGAEYIVNPSATVAGLSQYLWELEQPASAAANGVFIGAINRVGTEAPWNIGEFYGTSYFCNPRGEIIAEGPRDTDAVVVVDLDLDLVFGEAFLRRHIDRFLLQVVNEGDAVENRNESVEAWTECLAIASQALDDESGAGWYDPDRAE